MIYNVLAKAFLVFMAPGGRRARGQAKRAKEADQEKVPSPPPSDNESGDEKQKGPAKRQKQEAEAASALQQVLGSVMDRLDNRLQGMEKMIKENTNAAPLKEYPQPLYNMVQEQAVEIKKGSDKGEQRSWLALRSQYPVCFL